MKVARFALVLMPLICGAAEPPLLPTTEGTTWNYDLVQEKPSSSLDLTEPNEQEQIGVTYRLGGIEKIDNKDLRRLEIYRGENLESVDLIAVEEGGIICPARANPQGVITKFIPPQLMLPSPLRNGKHWKFEGAIGEKKVNQSYEVAGEEDIAVPAGKFHAWRIHCEQTSPSEASIDRWFVPGTGFVKVVTTINGASGLLLQKTSLDLKETPKVKTQPDAKSDAESGKLSVGLSKEPAGDFTTTFASNTPAIYARWQGRGLRARANIRVVWIAENVGGVASDHEMDEASAVARTPNSNGTFSLSQLEGGWGPGNYRVEFYVDNAPATTVKFKISK
jgi:hypothetical protein